MNLKKNKQHKCVQISNANTYIETRICYIRRSIVCKQNWWSAKEQMSIFKSRWPIPTECWTFMSQFNCTSILNVPLVVHFTLIFHFQLESDLTLSSSTGTNSPLHLHLSSHSLSLSIHLCSALFFFRIHVIIKCDYK